VYLWVWIKHRVSFEPQLAPIPSRKSHGRVRTGADSPQGQNDERIMLNASTCAEHSLDEPLFFE
jgi:hypothetical protein